MLVEAVGEDDMDEVPGLVGVEFLEGLVELYDELAACHQGVTEGSAATGVDSAEELGDVGLFGCLIAEVIEEGCSDQLLHDNIIKSRLDTIDLYLSYYRPS